MSRGLELGQRKRAHNLTAPARRFISPASCFFPSRFSLGRFACGFLFSGFLLCRFLSWRGLSRGFPGPLASRFSAATPATGRRGSTRSHRLRPRLASRHFCFLLLFLPFVVP